MNLQVTS